MKAQLICDKTEYYLQLPSFECRKLSPEELRGFLKSFDSPDHYSSPAKKEDSDAELYTPAGKVVAQIDDSGHLIIFSGEFFHDLFKTKTTTTEYLSSDEYAEKVGRKPNIVMRMCRNGRIPGAIQKGTRWLIPADAPYPADARVGKRVP